MKAIIAALGLLLTACAPIPPPGPPDFTVLAKEAVREAGRTTQIYRVQYVIAGQVATSTVAPVCYTATQIGAVLPVTALREGYWSAPGFPGNTWMPAEYVRCR